MRINVKALAVLGIVCLAIVLSAGAFAQMPTAYAPDELLVGVTVDADRTGAARQAAMSVGDVIGTNARLGVHRIRVKAGIPLAQAAAWLSQRPGVRYVEPNYTLYAFATPNDPAFATSQYGPQKMGADLAWGLWQPVVPVVIAIVDTGIDNTHPDLTNKILRYGGSVVGYSALLKAPDPALDDNGHGTHCAGIAAAQTNNGVGVAGIAGWNGLAGSDTTFTKLMPVKVLSRWGSGTTDQVADGICWAADNGANVISLSLGGSGTATLANAVSYAWNKGCLVVAAAGNSSSSTPSYPAAYGETIAVAATDATDTLCSFSNWGSWVSVAAPGNAIYSTTPTYAAGGGYALNYATLSGTSMACPHVAGEAALIWSMMPELSNTDVRALIEGTTDPMTAYEGRTIAGGRVNAYRALGGTTVTPPPPPPPTNPEPPTSLTATSPNKKQVNLGWKQSTSPDIAKNAVYRSTSATSNFSLIATVTACTSYTDRSVTSKVKYYYRVRAINASGLQSVDSATASVTVK